MLLKKFTYGYDKPAKIPKNWVWLPTRHTLSVESFLLITLHVSGPLTHHQESAVDVIQNFLHPYGYVCCSVCWCWCFQITALSLLPRTCRVINKKLSTESVRLVGNHIQS
jgi:hypothetical protein